MQCQWQDHLAYVYNRIKKGPNEGSSVGNVLCLRIVDTFKVYQAVKTLVDETVA